MCYFSPTLDGEDEGVVVMAEAEQVGAIMEEAECKRQDELGEVLGKVIEGLEKDLEEMEDQVVFGTLNFISLFKNRCPLSCTTSDTLFLNFRFNSVIHPKHP